MAAVAMLVSTLLVCAFFALDRTGHLSEASSYLAGMEAFSLRALLLYGLLPLVTASIMMAIYKPSLRLLAGTRPPIPVILAAPAAGFFAGWLVWCSVELALSLAPSWEKWLAIPLIWRAGKLYMDQAPLFGFLTFLAAAILPASSHQLLYRGIIQPFYMAGDRRLYRSIVPALLAAAVSLDPPGLAVLFIFSLLTSWARLASRSLFASSLLSAGFAVAMLLGRSLFGLLNEAIFKMPLIDPLSIRIFLVTMISALLVLLLAPLALTGMPARREKAGGAVGKKSETRPFRLANRIIGLLCLGGLALCLYFLA